MRQNVIPLRPPRAENFAARSSLDLAERLRRLIVGQEESVEAIAPYVELSDAGLAPEGRPVAVFLLLGPTGTGKTRTVEALAESLHGSPRNLLRIDCGEFQLEHEVAKLIGAPPGYLGHRETQPMITQQKLNAVSSEYSRLSLVLFDEIEKAAPSLGRLLLGVLDKASLKLGDNTTVSFENSIIFLTSNLGAREMLKEIRGRLGFPAASGPADSARLERAGLAAVRRRFSPEFVNRVDRIITYRPLDAGSFDRILDLELAAFTRHLEARLADEAFSFRLTAAARSFLLDHGTSAEYGARELKRAIHRHLVQPLARLVIRRLVEPGSTLKIDVTRLGDALNFQSRPGRFLEP